MVNIRQLAAIPAKTLRQIAKLRNISQNLSKSNIMYALICSESVVNEQKHIIDNNNKIYNRISKIRLQLFDISPYINKKELGDIRKRPWEIGKIKKIDRKLHNKLMKELDSISVELKILQKRMISDYRDDNYANIEDVEYTFGDLDNYYAPILTSSLFDKGYQRYHFRGDKKRNMSVKSYFHEISPYLRELIDENKAYERKIQIDIGFNMIHISNNRRMTPFSRSDNVNCLPSSNINETLEQLLTSSYETYRDNLELSREKSSFIYESVEKCNIHFHKIDLRRDSSFIDAPE